MTVKNSVSGMKNICVNIPCNDHFVLVFNLPCVPCFAALGGHNHYHGKTAKDQSGWADIVDSLSRRDRKSAGPQSR